MSSDRKRRITEPRNRPGRPTPAAAAVVVVSSNRLRRPSPLLITLVVCLWVMTTTTTFLANNGTPWASVRAFSVSAPVVVLVNRRKEEKVRGFFRRNIVLYSTTETNDAAAAAPTTKTPAYPVVEVVLETGTDATTVNATTTTTTATTTKNTSTTRDLPSNGTPSTTTDNNIRDEIEDTGVVDDPTPEPGEIPAPTSPWVDAVVPRHVGLICDGNRRWATQRNLPGAVGHLEGARRLIDLVRSLVRERRRSSTAAAAAATTPECLTLYAFSTENWKRNEHEISKIFEAIEVAARSVLSAGDLADAVDLRILGDLGDDRIPASLKSLLSDLETKTDEDDDRRDPRRLGVNLAVNYGGRKDIVEACRALAGEVLADGSPGAAESVITEEALSGRLSTGGMPPPDLIVRTGGEHRLSNFLLWEAAYAELYVTDVLWPDFSHTGEWRKSLDWYATRTRNFGGRADDDEDGAKNNNNKNKNSDDQN